MRWGLESTYNHSWMHVTHNTCMYNSAIINKHNLSVQEASCIYKTVPVFQIYFLH
jgi:hypothetical protein